MPIVQLPATSGSAAAAAATGGSSLRMDPSLILPPSPVRPEGRVRLLAAGPSVAPVNLPPPNVRPRIPGVRPPVSLRRSSVSSGSDDDARARRGADATAAQPHGGRTPARCLATAVLASSRTPHRISASLCGCSTAAQLSTHPARVPSNAKSHAKSCGAATRGQGANCDDLVSTGDLMIIHRGEPMIWLSVAAAGRVADWSKRWVSRALHLSSGRLTKAACISASS